MKTEIFLQRGLDTSVNKLPVGQITHSYLLRRGPMMQHPILRRRRQVLPVQPKVLRGLIPIVHCRKDRARPKSAVADLGLIIAGAGTQLENSTLAHVLSTSGVLRSTTAAWAACGYGSVL